MVGFEDLEPRREKTKTGMDSRFDEWVTKLIRYETFIMF